jgi:hypothetical protein
MIVGRISHQVRRLFSLLNFSHRFKKKSAQGDDRFVARSIPGFCNISIFVDFY